MSGGHFDYQQYRLNDIAEMIDELATSNYDETIDEFGNKRGRFYKTETILRFIEARDALQRAGKMVQRIDWLVSGDDGEESFHARWAEEVDDE